MQPCRVCQARHEEREPEKPQQNQNQRTKFNVYNVTRLSCAHACWVYFMVHDAKVPAVPNAGPDASPRAAQRSRQTSCLSFVQALILATTSTTAWSANWPSDLQETEHLPARERPSDRSPDHAAVHYSCCPHTLAAQDISMQASANWKSPAAEQRPAWLCSGWLG